MKYTTWFDGLSDYYLLSNKLCDVIDDSEFDSFSSEDRDCMRQQLIANKFLIEEVSEK